MRAYEFLTESVVDEAPLPPDWDETQFGAGTTFKQRLAYTLDRVSKIGTGSSRIATIINFEGRPTVLKVAKNRKGLAQNDAEATILSDGYAKHFQVLIPLIDYDQQNVNSTWIQTELAQKVTATQLETFFQCTLSQLVTCAKNQVGKRSFYPQLTATSVAETMKTNGVPEETIETFFEYVNELAELTDSFNVELGDFERPQNWGMYDGHPVVIDVGFTTEVKQLHYR